jgi:hypothetical protein
LFFQRQPGRSLLLREQAVQLSDLSNCAVEVENANTFNAPGVGVWHYWTKKLLSLTDIIIRDNEIQMTPDSTSWW